MISGSELTVLAYKYPLVLTGLIERTGASTPSILIALTSPLMDQLAEYDTANYAIGHGSDSAQPRLPRQRRDMSRPKQFNTCCAKRSPSIRPSFLLTRTPCTLSTFLRELRPSKVEGDPAEAFCGYHSTVNGQMNYAVMPFPGCAGSNGRTRPAPVCETIPRRARTEDVLRDPQFYLFTALISDVGVLHITGREG